MGWKLIGGHYYHKMRREGGRVVSDYIPTSFAVYAAKLDAMERERRSFKAWCDRDEMQRCDDVDRVTDSALDRLSALARAGLLAGGYHTHRRQWRHRRGDR